eukprot:15470594-Alexandrium_andersonii.AAC.1
MAEFRERFKCGKYVEMKDLGAAGTLVLGRRLQQHADSSFTMDVQEYAERKCHNAQVDKGYLSSSEPIDEEVHQLVLQA